ncbi:MULTISPECIES: Uma2 family endonuclease [unclassified Streptomyces]|uniref:Uma2 family endonuclease n=1 Tax=unclassified Streptomyces TaxID=2593676 RepID=UPI0008900843|nr:MULTISPECIES: Uma2 family endonuclease [unclassified Streptomyces]PBC84970.1 Uma2 family endonuclease [Streptomyces sp. 2321.6]SDR23987.1 Endonuclease, Uma2 family (restriction endonuclease fold) [Streptomyces sp. KS_16]SED51175.1 Endonuclease, Uma2 family (restriction endonuclease fold) [Streptomyces sp. 2133.1]SEE34807.1 Endonuclease, Uma2 family (restriction endonuclease fold) [Streptomyces sp. 2112.3]SNC70993.1 Endonuclease, Uma2 family (restriction endonuclease fold) [Streptomyces sp. 
MTALADRPHIMETEHFEEAARILARLEEGARLELIDGKVRSKPMPDGDHALIIEWLTRICIQSRPELWLYPDQGIKVQPYRRGRARPDGALAPSGVIGGQGEWVNPDPVLMAVEVTSHDSDTDQRDRVEKPRAYAETGIPIYLLIDRDSCEVSVYSEPNGARYEIVHTVPYGKSLHLPDPVGITLETEQLKDWVG